VRDNGRGIPAEAIEKVFEPFVRAARDESGLGIGLYVARTLVEGHGGEITVTSTGTHDGATFTVKLPELTPLLQQLSG
jgi:signal transduction histidine kinase